MKTIKKNYEKLKKTEKNLDILWNNLKNLREAQKFSTTNLILVKSKNEYIVYVF